MRASIVSIKSKYRVFILTLFLTAGLLAPLGAMGAQASLFISPSSKSYVVGQIFTVAVNISADLAVNAVEGSLVYPPDKLEALSVSKANSIINLWVNEPIISQNSGNVYFAGVILNPGYKGSGGKILSVNFRVKALGDVAVTVADGSILANDGFGTQVLSSIFGGRYKLEPKIIAPAPSASSLAEPVELPPPEILKISSPTHQDQNKWYANNNPRLEWIIPFGAEAVSFILDNSSITAADMESDGLQKVYEAENLESGIWYFHIRVLKNNKWSETAHWQLKIDIDPPEKFKIDFFDEEGTFNINPKIFFGAKDKLSGIYNYILKIDDGDEFVLPATVGEKSFLLPKQPYGKVNLTVKAYDSAGNFFSASRSINIVPRWAKLARALFESTGFLIFVAILTLISIVLFALIIISYFTHRKRKR